MGKCEYCHTDSNDYIKPLDKNCHVFINLLGIHPNKLTINWYGKQMDLPINYCPICGRDLRNKETVEIK